MKNPSSPKERGLVKGAIRRVFARSERRREVMARVAIEHSDPNRPRVKKWGYCEQCGEVLPAYTLEVDHITPVVPVDKALSDLTWSEFVDRLWVDASGLQALCERDHKAKTKSERELRKLKGKKEND